MNHWRSKGARGRSKAPLFSRKRSQNAAAAYYGSLPSSIHMDEPTGFPTRPARYPGTCDRCGSSFLAGDPVLWLARGKLWCAECCKPR